MTGAFNVATAFFFIKKMATPFEQTQAFKLGIIDKKGRVLKKMGDLETEQEKKAYTLLDRVIWNIKKLMSFIPGGGSMLAGVAAATALLMKEETERLDDPKYLQESFDHYSSIDYLPNWMTEEVVKALYEAAIDDKTNEALLKKLSDLWDKSKMDPDVFRDELEKAGMDDAYLSKNNLKAFVHSLIGDEPLEETPTNAVGTGMIKGTDQFPPFKRKKDMKTEAVDNSLNLLFESEEYSQMAFDEVNDFCKNFGLDPAELTEEEYIHLVDCLDVFARNMISETLSLTETTIMTEDEDLDELSMKTLGSYSKKASDSRVQAKRPLAKRDKSIGGIKRASAKMNEDHHEKDANGDPIPHDDAEGEEEVAEAKKGNYQLYHDTMSGALQHALQVALDKHKWEVDAEDWFQKVNMGPKKPSKGKTNSYSLGGYDYPSGKPTRKRLHAQVYAMDSGKFELNMYVEDRTQGTEMITEGTWALPDSTEDISAIQNLFQRPIPAKDAAKVLYSYTGDDGLFDEIDVIEKEDGKMADVRGAVKRFLMGKSVQQYMKKKKLDTRWVKKLKEDLNEAPMSAYGGIGANRTGLDRKAVEVMVKKQRIPAEVFQKNDDIIIRHKKYGDIAYNTKSDQFTFPSKTAKPLMKVWKKHTGENWKDAILGNRVIGGGAVKMFNLMKEGVEDTGTPIFVVSPEVYDQCKWGREKYQRWNKIVGEGKGESKIIEYGKKYPDRPIIVKNSKTEAMQYLRFGQMKSNLKEHYYEYIGLEQTAE